MVLSIQLTSLVVALLVSVFLSTGTYLILRRGQIRLVLGLGLFSHGINLLLFGSGQITRGNPPILLDKYDYLGAVGTFADPLPQALILTAIVISFGMTAFIVVLISRRDALTGGDVVPGEIGEFLSTADPFGAHDGMREQLRARAAEDYDILQYELDEVYNAPDVALPFHDSDEEEVE